MNATTRKLAAALTTAATVLVGIVGARAISNNDTSTATADNPGVAVLVDGDLDDQQAIPLLGPISGAGPDLGAGGEGASGGSPVIGGVFGPSLETPEGDPDPAGVDFSDPPLFYDPIDGISRLPERAFDGCAGPEPGALPTVPCPEGYAGTLFAIHMPPEPSIWGVDGAQRACPDAPATAMTVYSLTPLESLYVEGRPYGSSLAYEPLALLEPATSAAESSAWQARLEAEEYSLDFGFLAHCAIPLERDQNLPYELHLTGTDFLGRPVDDISILPDATPEGRPPTVVQLSETDSVAQMTAWTHDGGLITVGVFPLPTPLPGEYPVWPGLCELGTRGTMDPADIYIRDDSHPSPAGVYDPDFTRKAVASIPLTPGGFAQVCVTIYETDNTLRPLATDGFVLQGPQVLVPTIELKRVHFTEPRTVAVTEQLNVRVGTTADRCGGPWRLDNGLRVREAIDYSWNCYGMAIPSTETPTRELPIVISRIRDGHLLTKTSAIQLDYTYPPRSPVLFSVPIPPDGSRICGSVFGDESRCAQPGEGWADFEVSYDVVGWGGPGYVWPWGATDRPGTDPVVGAPILQVLSGEVTSRDNWHAVPITLSIGSDRPVTIRTVKLTAAELPRDSEPGCAAERTVDIGSGAATEFEVAANICPGHLYYVSAIFSDAAGVSYEREIGHAFVRIDSARIDVRVDFLGGEAPPFGWLYRFGLEIEGNTPDEGAFSGSTAEPGPRCRSLDDTVAEYAENDLIMFGSELSFNLHGQVTVTGETDCPLGGPGAFDFHLSATMTLDDLQRGEPWTFETEADAHLQLRVTLTGEWRIAEVYVG